LKAQGVLDGKWCQGTESEETEGQKAPSQEEGEEGIEEGSSSDSLNNICPRADSTDTGRQFRLLVLRKDLNLLKW